MAAKTSTKATYEEILGSKDWSGLLKPKLDVGLRDLLVRCADFCQATYDAFVSDETSGQCGNSRYGNDSFFRDIARLERHSASGRNYLVMSFLYATSGTGDPSRNLFLLPGPAAREPWDRHSNWMGYVAVTSDETARAVGHREIYVVWRGTVTPSEWTSNIVGLLQISVGPLLNATKIDNKVQVHQGWYDVYTSQNRNSVHAKVSARSQLKAVIAELVKKYSGEKVSVVMTGHSLGGVLATLSAFDMVENGDIPSDVDVAAIVFGCPQVGNEAFKDRVDAHSNLNILHVNNDGDLVPQLPDSALPAYIPIATAMLEIDHSGQWHDFSQNHSLIVTLDVLNGVSKAKLNSETTNPIVLQTGA